MMHHLFKPLLSGALFALSLSAYADAKLSQDDIRAAVRSGEIRPLAEIEDAVRGKFPGEVIRVNVQREGGKLIYEFKTIDARGRRYDVYINAQNGEILEIEPK